MLWPFVTSFTTEATSSTETHIFSFESFSLMVTDVSESTVIANGTPNSSFLAYLLPMQVHVISILWDMPTPVTDFEISSVVTSYFSFCTKGNTVHFIGANNGGKLETLYCSSPALLGHVLKQCSYKKQMILPIQNDGSITEGAKTIWCSFFISLDIDTMSFVRVTIWPSVKN